ncbi:MAG TPA: hypothetical protein VFV52_08735 [Bacilli bacterium]|nr:hypothetical protein [Bacilli bacterium]
MYSSWGNQLYHLAHYFFALLFLMWVVPRLLTAYPSEDAVERRLARFLQTLFFYILLGYVLVVIRLYEALALIGVFALLAGWRFWRGKGKQARELWQEQTGKRFYGLLDSGMQAKRRWQEWRVQAYATARRRLREWVRSGKWWPDSLLGLVIGGTVYLRFYDPWTSPAPGMSDGVVTLAWMKYISARALFHDDIYPQGFHIFLSYLHKFAAIDQLYILKYTGPLNGVLISWGLYFAVSRWSGNRYAGILACAVYGLGGAFLHGGDWERQAATNSQEFAYVWVFPAFYYMVRYLQHGRRQDLLTAAAACAIVGLVHSLAFGFVGIGVGGLLLLGVTLKPRLTAKRAWWLAVAAVGGVVVSVLPAGLGLLLGRSFHESSEEFLTATAVVTAPELQLWDYAALGALGLVLVSALVSLFGKRQVERLPEWFVAGLGLGTFALYEYGAVVTQSVFLESRTGSLWVLMLPACLGMGAAVVWQWLRPRFLQAVVPGMACLALFVGLGAETGFAPAMPYKMEWDSGVEQYLHITQVNRPQTWILFSDANGGYALAYGNGYHNNLRYLVETYDPAKPPLTLQGAATPDLNIPPDVYIYREKELYRDVNGEIVNSGDLTGEEKVEDIRLLDDWLRAYENANGQPEVFYEDEHLVVYHLHREDQVDEEQATIWGDD